MESLRQFIALHRRVILISFAAGIAVTFLILATLAYFLGDRVPSRGPSGSNIFSGKDQDGARLSNGKCEGETKPKLGTSPMRPGDFSFIIPYGLMVGGHVTPIDHQYFSPADFNSPLDAYPVYAMADAKLVEVQPREFQTGPKKVEYRMVFAMSCKLFYYYDLVTSLAGRVKEEYESKGRNLDLIVKEGELIGYIGSQTLDFAVWDMDVILPGLLVREHYDSLEPWKIHTVDPLDYYTDELKALILSRYVRTAEPISGKIDYDIDGRLIGNWFEEGTNGYAGPSGRGGEDYWKGHLSFAPNHWDPSVFMVSMGDFGGKEAQYVVRGNSPKPEDVTTDSGLVKYELVSHSFSKGDGSAWDGKTLTKGPKLVIHNQLGGCFLAQMLETRKLKAESFPGKACSVVASFSSAAKTYER